MPEHEWIRGFRPWFPIGVRSIHPNRSISRLLTINHSQYLKGASIRTPPRTKQDLSSTQEDHRTRFFDDYRKEAEEYDREFTKKYDEDLNTTLIFVSFV